MLAAIAVVVLVALVLAPFWVGLVGLALPAFPPPRAFVDVGDGMRLHVVDEGSGPAVVLVHGLPGSAEDWQPVPERLIGAGYRVIRYDRVGYGHSGAALATDWRSVAANGRELAALLAALEIDGAILVGWSYGGGVAQAAAAEAPERVRALVLVASDGPSSTASRAFARVFGATTPIRRWAVASVVPVRIGVALAERGMFGADAPPGWREHALRVLGAPRTVEAWAAEVRGFEPAMIPAERVAAPTVILQGTADEIVPPAIARDLQARIPGARLVLVEGAGHMLPNTHPDVLLRAIDDLAPRE